MKLEKRLEILEEQYLLMQKYHTICISDGSTIDYSNADYNRENMLIKKINGEEFETEYPMPSFDRVDANPAIKDMSKATVALVTSGGIVPKGNPDHIESSSASKYGVYDLEGVMDLTQETFETAHGGYDPVYANYDADRVLPVDVLRDLEKEGRIGKLHRYFYTTVGNGTSVGNSKGFAEEFGKQLKADGVDAVILTST